MLAEQGTGGTLGFVYVTDSLQARIPAVAQRLRELTGAEEVCLRARFGSLKFQGR
jgi:hypothetical protein